MASSSWTGQRALQSIPSAAASTTDQQRSITDYALPDSMLQESRVDLKQGWDEKGVAVLKVTKVRTTQKILRDVMFNVSACLSFCTTFYLQNILFISLPDP